MRFQNHDVAEADLQIEILRSGGSTFHEPGREGPPQTPGLVAGEIRIHAAKISFRVDGRRHVAFKPESDEALVNRHLDIARYASTCTSPLVCWTMSLAFRGTRMAVLNGEIRMARSLGRNDQLFTNTPGCDLHAIGVSRHLFAILAGLDDGDLCPGLVPPLNDEFAG